MPTAFVTFKDSTGDKDTFPAIFTRVVFGQRAFVADQWFLQFSFEQISSNPGYVDNETFQSRYRSYGVFSVGYFFPESRSIARNYF